MLINIATAALLHVPNYNSDKNVFLGGDITWRLWPAVMDSAFKIPFHWDIASSAVAVTSMLAK